MPLTKKQKENKVKNQFMNRLTSKIKDRENIFKQSAFPEDISFASLCNMNRAQLESFHRQVADLIKVKKTEERAWEKYNALPLYCPQKKQNIEDNGEGVSEGTHKIENENKSILKTTARVTVRAGLKTMKKMRKTTLTTSSSNTKMKRLQKNWRST